LQTRKKKVAIKQWKMKNLNNKIMIIKKKVMMEEMATQELTEMQEALP